MLLRCATRTKPMNRSYLKAALVVVALLLIGSHQGFTQTRKTIILVRHAEKDAAQAEMSGDPDLSAAGKERADRLAKIADKYRPGAVFSSDTKRTRQTADPTAKRRHLEVQIYDPQKHDELVKQIMASKTKRFLIVGHSNTIPALANLLTGKELFKSLDDNEYGTIWVIRLCGNQVRKIQVLSY